MTKRERAGQRVALAQHELIEALMLLDPTDQDVAPYRRVIQKALVTLEGLYPRPRRRRPR